jgi:phage portal protein BeeE
MTYVPMTMNATDAQLVEQLRMTDEDIAKCFHMPRHKVDIGPDPTFNNAEVLNQQYYSDCLQKHITKFQVKMTTGLEVDRVPGKTYAVELDLDDLILMDTAAKAEAASKAITSGMSFDEVRKRFWDLGTVKGGASPLAQQQNFSLEALAKRDASADPFGTHTPPPAAGPPSEVVPPDAVKAATVLQFKSLMRAAREQLAA